MLERLLEILDSDEAMEWIMPGAVTFAVGFFLYAAVAKSYFAFHQLPFWNPWYCGGNMLWQNPEVAILSPAYLFSLAMPLQRAMQWNIALHVFAGLVGMDVLTRRSFGLTAWPVRARTMPRLQ